MSVGVGGRQAAAAFFSARIDDLSAIFGLHALSETGDFGAFEFAGLVRAFHGEP
jgi:hypothetical protein